MTDYTADWIEYFTTTWDLLDWLNDYGTVYAGPALVNESPTEHRFIASDRYPSRYPSASAALYDAHHPDVVVTFEHHEDTVACFFIDAEQFTHLADELSPHGRLTQYYETYPKITLSDHKEPTHIDGTILVSQFSPFGNFFADTLPITNTQVNSEYGNIADDEDFALYLYGLLLAQAISRERSILRNNYPDRNHPSLSDSYHGILSGSPFGEQPLELPTALVSHDPETHDFEHPYWIRYNEWY